MIDEDGLIVTMFNLETKMEKGLGKRDFVKKIAN